MYEFGTGVEELAYAAQAFGYRGSLAFHDWSLAELRAQLDAGHPVVVALGTNGEEVPGHFVTVTGISADGEWVAYSDPAFGERVVPAGEFLAQWELQGNSGVVVGREAPSTPAGEMDLFPWVAFAAALMALVSTTPLVTWRKGIGGAADAGGGGGGSSKPATSTKSSKTAAKTSTKSSSTKKTSTSKSSTKTSTATKASVPAVVDDLQSEMKDVKGGSSAGAGTPSAGANSASIPATGSSSALDKVKEVEVGAASAGATPAMAELADATLDPVLAKGNAAGGSSVPGSTSQPGPSVAGSLEAKLAKVELVEVLGSVATAPLVMDDPVNEHWEVVGKGSQLEPEVREAGKDPAAMSGLTMPDWVRFGWRPPWVSSQDWYHMTPEDKQATWAYEAARITALVDQVSQVLEASSRLDGRPPSISLDLWNRLSMEERHALTADAVRSLSAVSGEIAAALSSGPQGQELVRSWLQWLELPITQMGNMPVDQAWGTYTSQYRRQVVLENSIHVRSEADGDGDHVGYLCGGDVVTWTGAVSYSVSHSGTRAEWREITYADQYGRVVTGWVRSDYLFEVMPVAPSFDPRVTGSKPPLGLLDQPIRIPADTAVGNLPQYITLTPDVIALVESTLARHVANIEEYRRNLCAFFAAAALVGMDVNDLLEDALTRLADRDRASLAEILAADTTTSAIDLMPILELHALDPQLHQGRLTPSGIAALLDGGHAMLALSGASSGSGELAQGGVGHWFLATSAISAGEGGWIHGYNSLTGMLEVHTYSEFEAVWGFPARGNSSHHTGILVLASQP